MRGYGGTSGRTGIRIALACLALAATVLAGCGSSGSDEPPTEYTVEVTQDDITPLEPLGGATALIIGVRNAGKRTLPSLTITVGIAGEAGRESALPFGIRDPQPDLASPDRPVWVLEEGSPRLEGSEESGGATTANPKTFDFGPIKPGETVKADWRLTAVRPGKFTLVYTVGAGVDGSAKAVTKTGKIPRGKLDVQITPALEDTKVNEVGKIVEEYLGE